MNPDNVYVCNILWGNLDVVARLVCHVTDSYVHYFIYNDWNEINKFTDTSNHLTGKFIFMHHLSYKTVH